MNRSETCNFYGDSTMFLDMRFENESVLASTEVVFQSEVI